MKTKAKFTTLSEIQKEKFLSIAGYQYDGQASAGHLTTDRPYNEPWKLSPWTFSYQFDPDTGYLYCELEHRMTNNRTYGWDQEGNKLPHDLVTSVYPEHF